MDNLEKQDFSVAATFDVPVPAHLKVKGYVTPGPFTPGIDPAYMFRTEILSDVLAWLTFGKREGLYLTGPTGSGKSSVVCQIAARLNIPVQRVTGHGRMEVAELVGHYTAIGGDLVWQDGPLSVAMRYGHWFVLDELDLIDPAVVAGLNTIVEGAPLVVAENGGEVVPPHEDFRFIATGNTAGSGDATGLYQGTLRQNLAFMDRFWAVEVGYPSPVQEEEILKKSVPNLPAAIRGGLIEIAGNIRNLFSGEENGPQIEVTMSTRTLVRWAHMSWLFHGLSAQNINPIDHALDRALGFRAEPATREALHEVVQRVFGNTTQPAAPSSAGPDEIP